MFGNGGRSRSQIDSEIGAHSEENRVKKLLKSKAELEKNLTAEVESGADVKSGVK